MEKLKKVFKARPFLSTGSFFLIITIISYLIAGEENGFVTATFLLTYLVFLVWLFIYLPIKFFINLKDKKVKKTRSIGGALVWILFLSFMGFFLYSMIGAYDNAEKKLSRKNFDDGISRFNSNAKFKEISLSNRQKRELSVKVYLIKYCKGGEETMKELVSYEQNIMYKACLVIQNNDFFSSEITEQDNVEKWVRQYLNTDFKEAEKLYDWYIYGSFINQILHKVGIRG